MENNVVSVMLWGEEVGKLYWDDGGVTWSSTNGRHKTISPSANSHRSGTEDERISAIGEHTEKPPAGYILHHLHRCCQNLPNGRGTKSLQDIKSAQSPITSGNKVTWSKQI